MKRSQIDRIDDILGSIVEEMPKEYFYRKAWLVRHWAEIAGERAAAHSVPSRLDRGTLFVVVDSSVWNQALTITKRNLLSKMNQAFLRPFVCDIRFSVGEVPAGNEKKGRDDQNKQKTLTPERQDLLQAEDLCKNILEPRLMLLLKKYYLAARVRHKQATRMNSEDLED